MEDLLIDYLTVDLQHRADEAQDLLQRICDQMDDPDAPCSIQDLIELLEPSLTSHEDKERWKATQLLAELFQKKTFSDITSPVLHLFVIFFCRRCGDFPSIAPSLQALLTLLQKYLTTFEVKYCDILDIVQTITKDIHIPSYAQNIRQLALQILQVILQHEKAIEQLQSKRAEIVDGIVNTMEEEKDPRCLLIALQIMAKVCQVFEQVLETSMSDLAADTDYETIADKIFDNISCYFPISFSPPPDDPFGITTEALVEALEQAMCTSRPIIKFSIPFFIEQINADISNARIHALNGLKKIVEVYGHVVLRSSYRTDHPSSRMSALLAIHDEPHESQPYLLRICHFIVDIACVEASEEIVAAVYTLLSSLTYSIGKDLTGKYASDWQIIYSSIIQKVFNECNKGIQHIDSLKMKALWKLLLTITSSGGYMVSALIVQHFTPVILNYIQHSQTMTHLHLQRYLQASYNNIKILTSFTNEERIYPHSIQMLQSLLNCAIPPSMDISAMNELNPLQAFQENIFNLLYAFVFPSHDTLIVNPTTSESGGKIVNKLDADLPLSLMLSLQAMTDYLYKTKGYCLNKEAVQTYCIRVMQVAIEGFAALFPSLKSSWEEVEAHINWAEETVMLQATAGDFFVKLLQLPSTTTASASIVDFPKLILEHCLPSLLDSILNMDTVQVMVKIHGEEKDHVLWKRYEKRCQLLGKLILSSSIANTKANTTLWKTVLQAFLPAMTSLVAHVQSSSSKGCLQVLQLWMQVMVSVLSLTTTNNKFVEDLLSYSNASIDMETSPILKLASLILTLPEEESIDESFNNLLSTTMLHLTVQLQNQFFTSFMEHFSSHLNVSNTSPRSMKIWLALLANYDKEGFFFQPSSSTSTTEGLTGFKLASSLLDQSLQQHDINGSSRNNHDITAQCFAVIVNKLKSNEEVQHLLHKLLDHVLLLTAAENTHVQSSSRCLHMYVWTVKAITLRPQLPYHSSTGASSSMIGKSWQEVFLSTFISCLSVDHVMLTANTSIASYCASEVMTLIQDNNNSSTTSSSTAILQKSSKGYFNAFWQQKLFITLYPILQDKLHQILSSSTTNNHAEVLVAMCKLMQGISVQLFKSNLKSLQDVMMKILSYLHQHGNSTAVLARVQTEAMLALQRMFEEDVAMFTSQFHIVIPKLIQTVQSHPEAKIRVVALECLAMLPQKMSYPQLHPHRKAVEKGLLAVLDDKKRAVRQLASKVRNDWILIE